MKNPGAVNGSLQGHLCVLAFPATFQTGRALKPDGHFLNGRDFDLPRGREKEWANTFLGGRDLDLPEDRKKKMNGANCPSEGKDAILCLRVPSPVPFFICANFVFLALLSVRFS